MAELPSPLIDVLSAESYAQEHLPGSLNFCVYEIAFIDKIREAFPDPTVSLTVYGLNDITREAGVAVERLAAAGYHRVKALPGGLEGWKAGEGPLERGAATTSASGRFEIDQAASLTEWMGRNLFNYHLGTVGLGSGHILVKNGQLTGGRITVDMTTMRCTDITDPALNAHLIGHLKSDDFFSVDQYPQAEFNISAVTYQSSARLGEPNYHLAGDFTLRGVAQPIDFPAIVAEKPDGSFTAQAALDLDRTRWGSIYGSAKFFGRLGQHLVNDELHLHLKVVTKGHSGEK